MQLKGQTVLITGGTSGIGRAFAEQFYREGSRVIVCGRRKERLLEMESQWPGLVGREADVSRSGDREELVQWLLREHPEVNVLINNAGVQLLTDLTRPVDLDRVDLEMETNFTAPLHLASLLTPHFREKPYAAIVNISSGLAFVPLSFMPVYCATKAALHSLTLSLRYQLRNTPVRVFEIAPPAVDTELGSDRRSDKSTTHGGMPVADFIAQAMNALRNDVWEAPIGTALHSREKREGLFEAMNSRFA